MTDTFEQASSYFEDLRDRICLSFESLDSASFERTAWDREGGGSGLMSIMKGDVFEKVGVNFSSVSGQLSEEFRGQIPGAEKGGRFRACGISLVAHMQNPKCPAAHMNLRCMETSQGWLGGGTDLTPYLP